MTKLGYWNTRAICEPIRILLHYVEEEFEDIRYQVGSPPNYDKSDWLSIKNSLNLTIPNLPYYIDEDNGVYLTQMHAIIFFLGEKYNLLGENPYDRAKIVMYMEGLRDWIYEFFDVTYCNGPWMSDIEEDVHHINAEQCNKESKKFNKLKEEYLTDKISKHLLIFENILTLNSTNNSMGLIGSTITVVDFILAEYLLQHTIFEPSILDNYPNLSSFLIKFLKIPKVQVYLESSEYKAEPLHNRYSHFHTGWIKTEC